MLNLQLCFGCFDGANFHSSQEIVKSCLLIGHPIPWLWEYVISHSHNLLVYYSLSFTFWKKVYCSLVVECGNMYILGCYKAKFTVLCVYIQIFVGRDPQARLLRLADRHPRGLHFFTSLSSISKSITSLHKRERDGDVSSLFPNLLFQFFRLIQRKNQLLLVTN